MILELRAKNCFVFQNQIVFSLDPFNKTTAIYGPNNVGKSCLIKCIQAMKDILLNKKVKLTSNLFSNNSRLNRYIGDMLIYSTLMMSI